MLSNKQIKNKLSEFIIIQRAIIADAFGIVALRRQTWLETYPNKKVGITYYDIKQTLDQISFADEVISVAKKIDNPNTRTWVAKYNNNVVAYVVAQKKSKENRIEKLYVDSNYQKFGIGRRLMNESLEWLGLEKEITLETASYNTFVINFYKSFGFLDAGVGVNEVTKLVGGKVIPVIKMIRYPLSAPSLTKNNLRESKILPKQILQ